MEKRSETEKKKRLREGDVIMTEGCATLIYLGKYRNRKHGPIGRKNGPILKEGHLYAAVCGYHGSLEETLEELFIPYYDLCTADLTARPKRYEEIVGHIDLAPYADRLMDIQGMRKIKSGNGIYVIQVNSGDLGFAKSALSAPGILPDNVDLVLGRTNMPDGTGADIRLCGTGDGEPAHLCAAIFTGQELLDYVRTEEFETTFVLRVNGRNCGVSVIEDPSVPSAKHLLDQATTS